MKFYCLPSLQVFDPKHTDVFFLSQDLATPEAFSRNPSRVWEFYQYRRELALNKKPNAAHLAIAECEARLRKQGRSVVVITQCVDDLHQQAGSKHVLKVHGESLVNYSVHMLTIVWELIERTSLEIQLMKLNRLLSRNIKK